MTERDRSHLFHFFVDAQPHQTPEASLTGAQIKQIANISAGYQLFLEEQGDDPDKPISDGQAVNLEGEPKHFFAVPPATFGVDD